MPYTISMTTAEIIIAIISAIGTSGGLWIAYQGLSTWKKQLKGNTEYDLSRRIIVSLLKHKNAINGVRFPAIFANEMPEPPEDNPEYKDHTKRHYYGKSQVYQTRWENVQNISTELRADLMEAEAIWGEQFVDLFKKIFELEHELFMAVRNHLDATNPFSSYEDRQAMQQIIRGKRDILYDHLTEDGDDYKNELNAEIKKIKEYLSKYLAH